MRKMEMTKETNKLDIEYLNATFRVDPELGKLYRKSNDKYVPDMLPKATCL